MFAPQNQQPNVIDSMTGSMEEWYNAVDEAVKKSEVIPGNYEYTVATSYGNVGKIAEDSSTYFDIIFLTQPKFLFKGEDYSNFMIGIPFCDSEDFMGGISTSGTVQIELNGIKDTLSKISYRATAICFEDALLKIRAVKPDGRSQIEITSTSIEQILAEQAV